MKQVELAPEAIDEIACHMEDSNMDWLFDRLNGTCIMIEEIIDPEDGRYISLPDWTSSDGYKLMEDFANSRKKKPVRDRLLAALSKRTGVFRSFRDALSEMPDVLNEYYAFKAEALGHEIRIWKAELNEIDDREPTGLESISDIIHEDYAIVEYEGDKAADLADLTIDDSIPVWYGYMRNQLKTEVSVFIAAAENSLSYAAENPLGESVAIAVWGYGGKSGMVKWIGCLKGCRGLGLETLLLEKIMETGKKIGLKSIVVTNAHEDLKDAFHGEFVSETFSFKVDDE